MHAQQLTAPAELECPGPKPLPLVGNLIDFATALEGEDAKAAALAASGEVWLCDSGSVVSVRLSISE